MEQWKQSVLIGVGLIIVALLFAYARGRFSILMGFVVLLGIVDIAFGLYRKKQE